MTVDVLNFVIKATPFGIAIGTGLLFSMLKSARVEGPRSAAARQLGVRYQKARFFGGSKLAGRVEGFQVEVAFFGGRDTRTEFRVWGLPPDLSVVRRSALGTLGRILGGHEIEIGDANFDENLRVQGSELAARGSLTANARAAVLTHLLERGGTLQDGMLGLALPGTLPDADEITRRTRQLLHLTRTLVGSGKAAAMVAENAARDPEPVARIRCLELLHREMPEATLTLEALTGGLEDRDSRVRWAAAVCATSKSASGDHPPTLIAGRKALLDLAMSEDIAENVRVAAIRSYQAVVSLETATELAIKLLDERNATVRVAAIALAEEYCSVRCVPRLEGLVINSRSLEPREGVALAKALAAWKQRTSEMALLKLLGSKDHPTQTAAAGGLGACGSVRSVEPLLALAHETGLLGNSLLRNAAEKSVKQIQARLAGAEAGQLSMTDTLTGGELSMAAPRGALSAPEQKKVS